MLEYVIKNEYDETIYTFPLYLRFGIGPAGAGYGSRLYGDA